MSIDKLGKGDSFPNEMNVVVEIASGSEPVKYEYNEEVGCMVVNRFLMTSMHYPCNYGFVPRTMAADGDPCDVLLVSRFSVSPLAVVLARPIGLMQMMDDGDEDFKVLCVPVNKLDLYYKDIEDVHQLPDSYLSGILHFFSQYKALEKKEVSIGGWLGVEDAKKFLINSVE